MTSISINCKNPFVYSKKIDRRLVIGFKGPEYPQIKMIKQLFRHHYLTGYQEDQLTYPDILINASHELDPTEHSKNNGVEIDCRLRDKIEQYRYFQNAPLLTYHPTGTQPDSDDYSKVCHLPTFTCRVNEYADEKLATLHLHPGFSEYSLESSTLFVVQCASSARGWSHMVVPYYLLSVAVHLARTSTREKVIEKLGNAVILSPAREDMDERTVFLTGGFIIRPFMHDSIVRNEYRFLYFKGNAKHKTRLMYSVRDRKEATAGYKQASLKTVFDEGLYDPSQVKEYTYSNCSETVFLNQNTALIDSLTLFAESLPSPFGAFDVMETALGRFIVLEFSPEFGTVYTNMTPVMDGLKYSIENVIRAYE